MQLSSQQVFLALVSVLVLTTTFSLPLLIMFNTKPVFGDGLTQEQLSASMGGRKADLLIKTIPSVVTTETLQNGQKPIILFRLLDSNTNQSFNHVTYYIIVEKDGKRLLSDMFHDHNGELKVQLDPENSSKIAIISAEHDPLLDIWTGSQTNPVSISGPFFLNGGLYHFIVKIETVDSDYTLLPDNQQPIYDSWLSVGNTENRQIDIAGKQLPVKIISYYDKLREFGFDNKTMQMKFVMPFNWNSSRLNKTNIFVHEEVTVPKANAFTTKGSFIAKVNGIDISKDLVVDNSNPKMDVIHVMMPKNKLIQLADQVNKNGQASGGLMKFTLQPGIGIMNDSMGSMSGTGSSMGSMS